MRLVQRWPLRGIKGIHVKRSKCMRVALIARYILSRLASSPVPLFWRWNAWEKRGTAWGRGYRTTYQGGNFYLKVGGGGGGGGLVTLHIQKGVGLCMLWCFYSTDFDQIIFTSTCTSDIVTVSVLLLAKVRGGEARPPLPPQELPPLHTQVYVQKTCHCVLVVLCIIV